MSGPPRRDDPAPAAARRTRRRGVIEVREDLESSGARLPRCRPPPSPAHRHLYRPGSEAATPPERDHSRLVSACEGRVVGSVRYRRKAARLRVVGLAVHPDEQRRGVARALVAELARAELEGVGGAPLTQACLERSAGP